MNDSIDLDEKIHEIRIRAIHQKDILYNELSNSFGIIIIFANNIDNVTFEKYEIPDKGVDPYLLSKHIETQSHDILYFKFVKNLKNEVKKFKCKPKKSLSKPEIIFSQISNKVDLKFGYLGVTEEQYENGKIKKLLEFLPETPVMNAQFKSNDATPSWNGFNFQGFITVLRTLQYMNNLPEEEYSNYSVEIEKYEDFIIYKNNVAQELFQVKAYVTEKSMSSYNEACEKLLSHRGQVGSNAAICFLATAAEITGWDESKFVKDISLYGYMEENFIATGNIIGNIKQEIITFFEGIEGDQGELEVDMAFACISRLIIDKIDYLHHHRNAEDEEYRIIFSDIDDILKNIVIDMHKHKLFFTKLEIDKKILANLDSGLIDYCEDCEKESCEFCPLNDLRESFESINREIYAKILDPTITIDDANIYVAEIFNGYHIRNMLQIFESVHSDILFCDNQHIYIVNESGIDDYLEKIIPSSIKIAKGHGLTKVLKGIQKDNEVQKIYDRSAVTAEMVDEIIGYKDQKIYVIPEDALGIKVASEKFKISPEFNFNLINKNTFVKRSLGNE